MSTIDNRNKPKLLTKFEQKIAEKIEKEKSFGEAGYFRNRKICKIAPLAVTWGAAFSIWWNSDKKDNFSFFNDLLGFSSNKVNLGLNEEPEDINPNTKV